MSVNVQIINKSENDSRECEAAKELLKYVKKSMPSNVSGKVYIAHNITMCGQDPRDLDIMFMCKLEGYKLRNFYTNDPKYPKKDLIVEDFCCAIELKEQSENGVEIRDSCVYVKYMNQNKNAILQNEGQRYSLAKYIAPLCKKAELFVTNFVWLKTLTKDQLDKKRGTLPIGALPNSFSFEDIVRMCLLQDNKPYFCKEDNCYHLTSDKKKSDEDYLESIKSKLFSTNFVPSQFTLKKISELTAAKAKNTISSLPIGKQCIEFQGKPGTGKTFYLLQAALDIANEKSGKRCLILTYNHALVSDIRRLLNFMNIPDGIDTYTIQIKTLHSFFIQLMKTLGIDTTAIYGNNFDRAYISALNDLREIVDDLMDEHDIKVLKDDKELAIDWDYIFIDEAQDWFDSEKSILERIYGKEHLIVANGYSQFIRRNNILHWGGRQEKLSYSRRQKNMLVDFVNTFAKEAGLQWETKGDKNLLGGEVIIRLDYNEDIHAEQIKNCKNNGKGNNYEILILVPPQLVVLDEEGKSMFKNKQAFEQAGIKIFDGTNYRNRCSYSIHTDESRLFQYESCRGLESWTTVCFKFDKLYETKMKEYVDPGDEGLVMKSPLQRKREYVFTWMLMPLTRAIDTLIITLEDPDSEVGQILKRVADKMPDTVQWQIDKF